MSIGMSYLMWRADHRLQRSARSNRIPEPSIALFGKNIHSFRTLLLGVLLLIARPSPAAAISGESGTSDAASPLAATVRAFRLDPQPLVALSFDDMSNTVYDTAFPILSSRGLPATFYFCTVALDDQWKAKLKDLENHGWEIGSHSVTHPYLTTLSSADLVKELSQSKADLESAGLKVTGFAYPYGIGGADADRLAAGQTVLFLRTSSDPG